MYLLTQFAAAALLLFALFSPVFAQAQPLKVHKPAQVWGGLEIELEASEKNTFYFDNQWRHVAHADAENLSETGLTSAFEDVRFTVGYERLLSPNWSVELAQRISLERDETKWYNRLMLNYERSFGLTELESRVMYEHIRARDNTAGTQKISPENRTRANLGLTQPFRVGNSNWELMSEGEVLFQLNEDPEEKPRLVDRTRIETGLTFLPNQVLSLTVFAIRQVRYKREQPASDRPDANYLKLNEVTPIFGFEIGLELP